MPLRNCLSKGETLIKNKVMSQEMLPVANISTPVVMLNGKEKVSEKKRNGVFYTPERATQILTKWAIKSAEEKILEPSFGGCEFLNASRNRLIELGNKYPQNSLYGCDIDENAFKYLRVMFDFPDEYSHFKKKDFLLTSLDDFPLVDAIVGNPPYVSLHNMPVEQRELARRVAENAGLAINGRANLWTYFLLHSLSFLKPGGRMAWILPGSFIYSEYVFPLKSLVENIFGKCLAVLLEDRIFLEEGTVENSVVLLCDSYHAGENEIVRLVSAKGLSELDNIIENWTSGENVGNSWIHRPQLSFIEERVERLYSVISNQNNCYKLGSFLDIKIGIVTGDNKFFVINNKQADKYEIPISNLEPILAKFSLCKGIELTCEDIKFSQEQGDRCLLINTSDAANLPESITAYLNSYPEEKRLSNVTFKGRSKHAQWHQVHNNVYPDAFFSSMQSEGPILMINTAKVACTNSVYQVKFHLDLFAEFEPDHKMLAVTLQSTFSQFSAEIEGRSSGHGALKVEPSEAKKIAVLLTENSEGIDEVFGMMDECFRREDRLAARQIADSWLIRNRMINEDQIAVLNRGLISLRNMRNGYRKGVSI